jgi:hypothetical protein
MWKYVWDYKGFGLIIGFIGLLKLITTKNYGAIANSRTLQFTIACFNSSQFIFTSHCLATAFNNVLFCSRCYQLSSVLHLTHGCKCPHIASRLCFQQFSIVASCVYCCRNMFIGHSLATAVSSSSTFPIFQMPCHSIILMSAYLFVATELTPSR